MTVDLDTIDGGAKPEIGSYRPGQPRPDRINLRDTVTKKVAKYYAVDAREIMAMPDTRYEPADEEARQVLERSKRSSNGQ